MTSKRSSKLPEYMFLEDFHDIHGDLPFGPVPKDRLLRLSRLGKFAGYKHLVSNKGPVMFKVSDVFESVREKYWEMAPSACEMFEQRVTERLKLKALRARFDKPALSKK
ncbi:MAG: hypothetical protein V4527_00565 [Pseudomonadota bacterium]